MREIRFVDAVREALEFCMSNDPRVYVMGLGVPDPGAIFGSTKGLRETFGEERVLDMPIAENGMTGIAIGSALAGMRPVLVYQRVEFMLLAVEQIVNQAAKWHYTFNGESRVPLVLRVIMGRGWGQGPQHSQSLHSWFAHVPGLKVVMPFTPADARGLLVSAIEDDNPVLFFEHRWLHNLCGPVGEEVERIPLGKARILREGTDVTLFGVSHMSYECLRAANLLEKWGISCHVVDLRCVRPLDRACILESAARTGRMLVADPDWGTCGLSAEIIALVTENMFGALRAAPVRIAWPEHPVPTSHALTRHFYPDAGTVARAVFGMLQRPVPEELEHIPRPFPHDVPDLSFTGPF